MRRMVNQVLAEEAAGKTLASLTAPVRSGLEDSGTPDDSYTGSGNFHVSRDVETEKAGHC